MQLALLLLLSAIAFNTVVASLSSLENITVDTVIYALWQF